MNALSGICNNQLMTGAYPQCRLLISYVLALALVSSSACQTPSQILADQLGSIDLQTTAYISLLSEAKGARPCLAQAEVIQRRPVTPPVPAVIAEIRKANPGVRGYSERCTRSGADVVAIAWTESDGTTATVGASRWYGGSTTRGGVLCELQLRKTVRGWETVRPCSRTITTIVN